MSPHYPAPWGWRLKVSTTIACFVVGVPAAFQLARGRWIGLVLAAALLASLPFVIRGYTITATHLEIHRLLWTTRWPLAGLQEACVMPGAMAGSWRTWGNGGIFAIHGWFRNAALGPYRAFVTDPSHAVVLRWPRTTVVVSPGEPDRFVRAITSRIQARA